MSKRTDTEFGARGLMDLDEDDSDRRSLSLPGVKSGDMASRHFKPEVKVYALQFSPTGTYVEKCGALVYRGFSEELIRSLHRKRISE